MEHKSGCLVCGKELVYLKESESGNCIYCNKEFNISVRCTHGHFICDKCHSSCAMDIIEEYCQNTMALNPIDMANTIMQHPSVKMHGPEHHFLVPAVLLAAYYNLNDSHNILADKLQKARKRAEKVPGGFCGTHGNCGAGVGSGIFISLITEATPLSTKEWQLSNMMTAKSLMSIAECGGPRCCKRDTYLSLTEAVKFLKEQMDSVIPLDTNIKCNFSEFNNECLKEVCPFYKGIN
jgi:hypothetical protein